MGAEPAEEPESLVGAVEEASVEHGEARRHHEEEYVDDDRGNDKGSEAPGLLHWANDSLSPHERADSVVVPQLRRGALSNYG